ncbi:MAG: pantetheine-phosphate adenylyltransferase [Deltaproteobacteria bacterium]|nr:pantetheine-phosphate adenylyltransferase [Deltaproteobacteria bacterium]
MEEKIAVYPGSFDPVTYGHIDIIKRALKIFDKVIVAVAHNYDKKFLFTPGERVEMIEEALKGSHNVIVESFEGLLMEYMKGTNAKVVLRGLRATSDFEYEYHMASMNRSLNKDIDTLFMVTGKDYFFISSRTIKEVTSLGGSVEGLVPENVARKLREKFAPLHRPHHK